MTRALFPRLFAVACLPVFLFALAATAQAGMPEPSDPVYIRDDGGWDGFWQHGPEFVEYAVGGDVQLQDAYHVMLRPRLGMMLTFADRKNFGADKNLLEAHRQWELDYWRSQAGDVKSKNRDDLAGAQRDLMVTELDVPQQTGGPLTVYMIGVAGTQGVYVFSISPVTPEDEPLIRKIIASVKIVHKPLDIKAEASRIRTAPGQKN